MKSYKFTITRTYETIIEIDANNKSEAISKLEQTDVYAIELEQCCVVEESIKDEQDEIIHSMILL